MSDPSDRSDRSDPSDLAILLHQARSLLVEQLQHLFHVFPDGDASLLRVVAEEVRGVEGGHELHPLPLAEDAAVLRDGDLLAQQAVNRRGTHRHDYLRMDRLELLKQISAADQHFIDGRHPVLRRSALHNIADVDLVSVKLHSTVDDLGEQLASPADKWPAEAVFVLARALADEDEVGTRIAFAEDGVRTGLAEITIRALAYVDAKVAEGVISRDGRRRGNCGKR